MVGGLAAGMAGLALVRPDGSFWLDVLPASLVSAAGGPFGRPDSAVPGVHDRP